MVGAEVIVQVQQRYSCAGVEKVMRQRRCRAGAVAEEVLSSRCKVKRRCRFGAEQVESRCRADAR